MPMRARVASALAATLVAAGCGMDADEDPVPAACTEGRGAVLAALRAAPGAVAMRDGTRLSTCLSRATGDGDLQNVGATLTGAAEALARQAPASDEAALQLGYLVGAARRGASGTDGVHVELVRRLEFAVALDGAPTARRAALARGMAAGNARG